MFSSRRECVAKWIGPCSSLYSDAKVGGAVDHGNSGRGLGSVQGLSEEGPHGCVADENESKAGGSHGELDLVLHQKGWREMPSDQSL